ncbi:MAG: hypothetical protein IKE03_10445, partial [Blautia sp.]|nr:hypothetical protein [Blautia sp.]
MRNNICKWIVTNLCFLLCTGIVFGGCSLPSLSRKTLVMTATPSPTPEPAPTIAPTATPTPSPTATPTPAPRQIGSVSGSAGFVYVTNETAQRQREIHLQLQDSDEWSRNLIPSDSSIRGGERFRLYYPAAGEGYSNVWNMQVRTDDSSLYSIYTVNFTDMETANLLRDSDGALYLTYMSLSEQAEKNTRDTSWTDYSSGNTDDWDYYDYEDNSYSDSGSADSASA